ncbi:MAG: sulfurtransferase TusA family protein [Kordiimonadaceae bacterium]|nr:sulfurtransferase TusA family protein [Kordiimonadaceae bacterium]MBO6568032.1 sulfurtransferase TusA family protein [Kordiimonadaceae bacterium]MBO6964238.1 sulfurtransferase TusA family protein [Kordiimonadaceae bacterium]
MENPAQDIDLDLRGTVCPMAFVKLRLFADQLSAADTFSALYEDTHANEPLVRSIEGVGHKVLSNQPINLGGSDLRIIRVQIVD